MSYRQDDFGLLVRLMPAEARQRLLEAYQAGGTMEAAAKQLGCDARSLYRHVEKLGMKDRFAKLFAKNRTRRRKAAIKETRTA
jgi:transposase-like protein